MKKEKDLCFRCETEIKKLNLKNWEITIGECRCRVINMKTKRTIRNKL